MLGKTDFSPPMGCTFREGFGDGFGTRREGFGDGFGTYQGRGCLEKRIFPLLWGVRFGKVSVTGLVRGGRVSVTGLVRIRGVGAWKNGFFPSYGVYVSGGFR